LSRFPNLSYLVQLINIYGDRNILAFAILAHINISGNMPTHLRKTASKTLDIGSCTTGRFIMYTGITEIYYRETVGHVFTKPVHIWTGLGWPRIETGGGRL